MVALLDRHAGSSNERGTRLMATLLYLVPIALLLGGLGLTAFVWALKSGQYEDMDGAAERVLLDD